MAAVAAVALTLLSTIVVAPPSLGEVTSPEGLSVLEVFEDLQSTQELSFPGPGYNDDTAVVLPNHAFVDSAQVNMSFGTFPGTDSAPWDPELDVGSDGSVDWGFDSDRGGPLGLQDSFSDGDREKELRFEDEDTREFYVNLPRQATITEAYLDVEGFPIPHWVDEYKLTPRTDSPGEYGPKMAEYDDGMWVIWQSEDQNITVGADSDVVVRRFDGERWGPIIELTEPHDSDEDDIPQIIAFNGKLYGIWSKGDGRSTVGGESEIVYSEYDGEDWGPVTRVSGPKGDGLNTYERCVVYKDQLYIFWKTTDPSYSVHDIWSGDDMDIVYRSFDGTSWSSITEITDSNNDETDWSVDVVVYRGMLYAIWDTWERDITGRWGNVDVVSRAFDGTSWTRRFNLSPYSDRTVSHDEVQDALPRLYIWDNPVTGDEELFAIWMRGRTILPPASGDGFHIVYRRYSGVDWSPMEQLSFEQTGDPADQMFPMLVAMNETLYAIWVVGTNTTERIEGGTKLIATYGDIIIRSFDGETWSPVLELTPLGNGYDDASHPSVYVYGGKLFAAWETPLPTGHDSISWEIVMRHLEITPVTISLQVGGDEGLKWGWERLSNTKQRIYLDPDRLTEVLNSSPYTVDGYGNRYAQLPMAVSDKSAANLRISNLTIRYDYSVTVDFTEEAEAAVTAERDNTHVDKDVRIPLKVSTGQMGTITLEDPLVTYRLDYPPLLLENVPGQQVFEDEARRYLVDLSNYFTDDWDNGNLTFTILEESDPELVDVYLEGEWLSVSLPAKNWNGAIQVVVRAHDRHPFYWNDSNEFEVTVLPVNDAPVLGYISDKELEVDVTHTEFLSATDPDEEDRGRLTFTTDSEVVTVGEDGRLEVTLRPFHPREVFFNVTVWDPQGANDTQEVRFNYTMARVTVQSEDDFPYYLFLLLLLILALVVAERMRRPYRMTEEERIWDEEAEHEELERAEASGSRLRRFF